jgi:hypothetical protein
MKLTTDIEALADNELVYELNTLDHYELEILELHELVHDTYAL